MDFTPASPSESVRLAKQNMTDQFSVTGWAVLDQKQNGNIDLFNAHQQIFILISTSSFK